MKHRISDYAEILTIAQEDSLLVIMEDLEMKIGAQVAVLSLPSLNGQKMEEFAFKTAEAARLGRRTHNDGVLIVIADYERQMRIEVGTGLETILTDEVAARILREDMAPKFGEGKYCLGLYLAIDKISSLIKSNEEKIGQQP